MGSCALCQLDIGGAIHECSRLQGHREYLVDPIRKVGRGKFILH